MSPYMFKWFILIIALSILTSNGYGKETKGYKIILASYPKFDEAKRTMELLGKELTEEDWAVQKKYGYQIVARPSGKVFILAMEPFENKKSAEMVLKRFNTFYPTAYSNGYFGPTERSLFLTHPSCATTTTKKINSAQATATIKEEPTIINPSEKSLALGKWIGVGIVVLGILLLNRLRKISKTTPSTLQEEIPEVLKHTEKEEELPNTKTSEPITVSKEDIFYTLKKNKFFILLVNELQEASKRREIEQCHDLIQEMRRYEKKFHASRIITEMEELINAKKFRQLIEFIAQKSAEN